MTYFVRFDDSKGKGLAWLVYSEDSEGKTSFVAAFPTKERAYRYARVSGSRFT